jgi:hypothetical protein
VIDTGHGKVPINEWRQPGTDSNGPVGTLPNGTVITIVCQVHGRPIRHGGRTTDLWDAFEEEDGRRYHGRRYVFDGLVETGSDGFVALPCDAPDAPPGMASSVSVPPRTQKGPRQGSVPAPTAAPTGGEPSAGQRPAPFCSRVVRCCAP